MCAVAIFFFGGGGGGGGLGSCSHKFTAAVKCRV